MQLAATGNLIAKTILSNFKCDIGLKFFVKAVGNLPGGGKFAFFTLERASVRTDINTEGWWFKLDSWESFWIVASSNSISNISIRNTGYSNDIAGKGFLNLFLTKTTVDIKAVNFSIFRSNFWFTIFKSRLHYLHRLTVFDFAAMDFTDGVFTEIIISSKRGDKKLQAFALVVIDFWRWHIVDNGVEDDMEIIIKIGSFSSFTITSNGVINWVVKLRLICCKLQEEIRNLVLNFLNASSWLINFINDNNWL